jgi:hypothetical protein
MAQTGNVIKVAVVVAHARLGILMMYSIKPVWYAEVMISSNTIPLLAL